MSEEHYLMPERLKLWRVEDGSLLMKNEGRKILVSPPRRAAPLTMPDEFILFFDLDGNEVGVLRRVSDLEDGSQQVLREALAREYVLERITRILEVEREPLSGQTRWRVEIEAEVESAEETSDNSSSHSGSSSAAASQSTLDSDAADGEEKNGEEKSGLSKVVSRLSLSRDRDKEGQSRASVEREFTISGQEDVQTARYPHIFIVDTERRRYEILDCEALDIESRRAAERFF